MEGFRIDTEGDGGTRHDGDAAGDGARRDASQGRTPTPFVSRGDHTTFVGVPDGAAEFEAGQVIGDQFEVVRVLGRGGMGVVYEVNDRLTRQRLALKTILPSILSKPKAVERFVQEVNTARRLRHHGIVAVYDVRQVDSLLFFTMEYVEGKSLRQLLNERGRLPLPEVVALLDALCDALEYAHQYTVHRDLSPENVMVLDGAEGPARVKLLDFGIAKAMEPSTFTATQVAMGKAYYMAPEQRKDAAAVDPRADIWSLGVMFFEMLSGEMPMGYSRLTDLAPELPEACEEVVRRTIVSVEQRYKLLREARVGLRECYASSADRPKDTGVEEDGSQKEEVACRDHDMRHDDNRERGSLGSQPQEQEPPPEGSAKLEVADDSGERGSPADALPMRSLVNVLSRFAGPRYYLDEMIPEKKLAKLRRHFPIPDDERVILLYDSTFFGSGKNGMAITEKGIHLRDLGQEVISIPWRKYADCELRLKGWLNTSLLFGDLGRINPPGMANPPLLLQIMQDVQALSRGEWLQSKYDDASVPPVGQLLDACSRHLVGSGCSVGAMIDERGQTKARRRFGIPDSERIVLILDEGLFGGGLAVAEKGLFFFKPFDGRARLSWRQLAYTDLRLESRKAITIGQWGKLTGGTSTYDPVALLQTLRGVQALARNAGSPSLRHSISIPSVPDLNAICSPCLGARCQTSDGIPAQKLARVRRSFSIPNDEVVFLLLDTTDSSTGKSGLAISREGVRLKEDWKRVVALNWTQLAHAEIKCHGRNTLVLGGQRVAVKRERATALEILQRAQSFLRGGVVEPQRRKAAAHGAEGEGKDRERDEAHCLGDEDAPMPKPGEQRGFDGVPMAWIPPGEFQMGSKFSAQEVQSKYGTRDTKRGLWKHECPQHNVRVTKGFWMGQYAVTNKEFLKFVEATDYLTDAEMEGCTYVRDPDEGKLVEKSDVNWRTPGWITKPEEPVVCVSWNDATAYCKWLSERSDATFRLPTEAEWEYACRAGTTTAFQWGDDVESGEGWLNASDTTKWPNEQTGLERFPFLCGYRRTAPVGRFEANRWGLYDMHGNVMEWCQDRYGPYSSAPATDPTGVIWGKDRVARGGAWCSFPAACRSASRLGSSPDTHLDWFGFRVVRTP